MRVFEVTGKLLYADKNLLAFWKSTSQRGDIGQSTATVTDRVQDMVLPLLTGGSVQYEP